MSKITMDVDWGARGAQLRGSQVQEFIKSELKKLISSDELIKSNINTINNKLLDLDKVADWNETNTTIASYIKNKPEIPTVTALPNSDLKSYINKDNNTISFKVGDFVRYKNSSAEYLFYQLIDISDDGTPIWNISGGSGASINEQVKVHIITNQTNNLDVKNVKATVSFNSQTFQISDGQHVNVPPKTLVNITFPEVAGYKTPNKISFTTVGGMSSHTAKYETEVVSVTISAGDAINLSGQKISINGATFVWDGNIINHKIPYGTSYNVSVDPLAGYDTPSEQSFIANQPKRNINFVYQKSRLGVFIQTINGDLFKHDQWNNSWNSNVNGIAIISTDHSFVMSTSSRSLIINNLTNKDPGLVPISDAYHAKMDFHGKVNTSRIKNGFENVSIYCAAGHCTNYKFPNGKTGYLGAAGEWNLIINNLDEVQKCLLKIGCTQLQGEYWTSTYVKLDNTGAQFWAMTVSELTIHQRLVSIENNVLPFTEL